MVRDAVVGDVVYFGAYPQGEDGVERTPIQWRVLQAVDGDVLLLSEYLLDCKRYHRANVDITWRDCDLRAWLADAFYEAAFSEADKTCIRPRMCDADTEDRVSLLSAFELKAFTDPRDGGDGKIRRRTVGTKFAALPKADGCRLYVYDKGVEADYVTVDGEKRGCSWWWTRTQTHEDASRATFVGPRSNVKTYGQVATPYYGVRPVIQIAGEMGV